MAATCSRAPPGNHGTPASVTAGYGGDEVSLAARRRRPPRSAWSTRWISRLTTSSSDRPGGAQLVGEVVEGAARLLGGGGPPSSAPCTSRGSCAEMKTRCPVETPAEATPKGPGAMDDLIACLLMRGVFPARRGTSAHGRGTGAGRRSEIEDLRRQDRRVAGAVDGDAGHRHAGRHLHDAEQRVEAAEVARLDGHADHRQVGVRGEDAGEGRRLAGAADEHLDAARLWAVFA